MADKSRTIVGIVAGVGILAGLVMAAWWLRGGGSLAEDINRRTLIDATTGEVFVELRLPTGATSPFKNPKTGTNSLYLAEACFWNADGTAKLQPTWVLLNEYKGINEPTMCPDCNRRVVGHNPMPPVNLLAEAHERSQGRKEP